MNFRKSLFGFKPQEVLAAFEQVDNSYRQRISELELEMQRTRQALAAAEEEARQLQKKLAEYEEQKQIISEILIAAHKKAQQIEAEARESARVALETVNAQIRVKEQELNMLKARVEKFKEDFKEILEQYRYSLENFPDLASEKAPPLFLLKERGAPQSEQKPTTPLPGGKQQL